MNGLNGLCIVDFTRYLPGPFATQRLADLGATVIKVESPRGGDPARSLGIGEENEERKSRPGSFFLAYNRGKKSVTIDLKRQEGQELAFRLASQADVVVEGFRPGVADNLGIGYERLKKGNPSLIYCSITGFGQTGPWRSQAGHDLNYVSASGLLSQLKDAEGRPIHPGIQLADLIGGLAAAEAILAAVVKREKTGRGEFLDLSLTDALIGLLGAHVELEKTYGCSYGYPFLGGEVVSYKIYKTKDERYVSLAALEDKFWHKFCRAVEKEEWLPLKNSPADEKNPIFREIQALFLSRTWEEWKQFGQTVDCCLTPVQELHDLTFSPHVRERRLIRERSNPLWGPEWQVSTSAGGFCAKEDEDGSAPSAPTLGQHTREILHTLLQASPAQLNEWEKQGII